MVTRILKHMLFGPITYWRYFGSTEISLLEQAIAESESLHSAQVCLAIDPAMNPWAIIRGVSPRQRAIEVFSNLGVWNTTDRNGVLLFVQLADRDIEIVADIGLNDKVPQADWEVICRKLEQQFSSANFVSGLKQAIIEISAVLATSYPTKGGTINEISDKPKIV